MLDVVTALNSLEELVRGNETRTNPTELYYDTKHGFSLVGAALHATGMPLDALILLGPLRIEHLYERSLLPISLTVGAVVVYRAVQRTQDGLSGSDRSWGAAFDNAIKAASRVIDLIPGSAMTAAWAEQVLSA